MGIIINVWEGIGGLKGVVESAGGLEKMEKVLKGVRKS